MSAPLTQSYNLARLGNAGDKVQFQANPDQRAAIAELAGALSLERWVVAVDLKKTSSSRFLLSYRLEADITQACVVTLEPVLGRVAYDFARELHFGGGTRRPTEIADLDLSGEGEDEPEEIESLHYDLAEPALEEFLLSLDPYPRCPGVEFDAAAHAPARQESPFAVLKGLKPSK